MVGPENLLIGKGLGTNMESLYFYFEFLHQFKIPLSNEGTPSENWMFDYSNWKQNKENNMKFLIQKIEMHSKYANKITEKVQQEWIQKFHISNVVKLQEFNQLEDHLFNFQINETYFLKYIYNLCAG